MDHAQRLAAIEAQVPVVVGALDALDLDGPVPTCPEWVGRDLAVHLGGFVTMWTESICEATGDTVPEQVEPPDTGTGAWWQARADRLVELLRAVPLDTDMFTFDPDDRSPTWAARRILHELTVHRVDAEVAAFGRPSPVSAEVAADGVREVFTLMDLARGGQPAEVPSGRTLHLHPTDGGEELTIGELTLTVGEGQGEASLAEGHPDHADLTLAGQMGDLELVLYSRPTVGEVERTGDQTVLDAWYRAFTFG